MGASVRGGTMAVPQSEIDRRAGNKREPGQAPKFAEMGVGEVREAAKEMGVMYAGKNKDELVRLVKLAWYEGR